MNALAPHLNNHGIVITPEVLDARCEQLEIGQKKSPMLHVALRVKYRFSGPAGDFVESTVYSQSLDSGDKAAAKAMSVAYRIALLQTFNLPTQEPDPDSFSYGDYEQNGGFTGNAKTANSANSAKTAQAPVKPDWVSIVENTDNVETLRSHFKEAGRLGQLQDSLALSTGERMTLEQALIARGDALNLKSGANGAGAHS